MAANERQEAATVAKDRQSKKDWDSANMVMVSFKLFRAINDNQNDQDIIEWLNSTPGKRSEKIKAALREYMNNHPKEYRYGMRLRGFSPGAQPKEVLRREDDPTGKYYDIIVYDRPLSADEIADYELDDLN